MFTRQMIVSIKTNDMKDDLLTYFESFRLEKHELSRWTGGGICTSRCTHKTSTWDTVTDTDFDDGNGSTVSDRTLLGGIQDILDIF